MSQDLYDQPFAEPVRIGVFYDGAFAGPLLHYYRHHYRLLRRLDLEDLHTEMCRYAAEVFERPVEQVEIAEAHHVQGLGQPLAPAFASVLDRLKIQRYWPLHRRLRAPLEHGIAQLGRQRIYRSVTAVCDKLLTGFGTRKTVDLVADYAAVVPMLAVAAWFGLDAARGEEIRQGLLASGADSQAGNHRFEQILLEVLHARQHHPADDLTTLFLQHPGMGLFASSPFMRRARMGWKCRSTGGP